MAEGYGGLDFSLEQKISQVGEKDPQLGGILREILAIALGARAGAVQNRDPVDITDGQPG